MADMQELIARLDGGADVFWSRVQRPSVEGCWPWTGYKNDRGYGVFRYAKSKAIKTHRLAYALDKGAIPEGMIVCHSCDNPPCCNPAHLWLGTYADNNRDRNEKGRTRTPFSSGYAGPRPAREGHGSAKLTEAAVNDIRSSSSSGAQLARAYGVSESTISRVRAGTTWGSPIPNGYEAAGEVSPNLKAKAQGEGG